MNSLTGYNLISKVGKTSINRHKILKEKEEILGQPSIKSKTKKSPKNQKKVSVLEALKQSINSSQEPKPQVMKTESLSNLTSPKKVQSLKVSFVDDIVKSRELLSPSYKAQDKHVPSVIFRTNLTIKRKPLDKVVKVHHHSEKSLKLNSFEKSGISFDKQLPRDFVWMQKNLSDKRFLFNPPQGVIKSGPTFDKQASRLRLHSDREVLPDYFPEKEKVMRKISKNIDFEKYLDRNFDVQKKFLPDVYDVKLR